MGRIDNGARERCDADQAQAAVMAAERTLARMREFIVFGGQRMDDEVEHREHQSEPEELHEVHQPGEDRHRPLGPPVAFQWA